MMNSSNVTFTNDNKMAKMSRSATFFAICKGYCAINILILPKNFSNGGWLVGVLSVFLACFLVLFCARKLVECANKTGIYNYGGIAL